MKELNKRASGQAFEVILSPSTPDAKVDFLLSPLKKKETSLDEIKRKLDAAEERRRVSRLTAGFISRHKEKSVARVFYKVQQLFCLSVRATKLKC